MRIMQVIAGGGHGGAETAFCDMSVAFLDAGQEVLVVCRPNEIRIPLLKKAGISVIELPFGGMFDFQTKRQMRSIIKKFKPDIIVSWMSRASHKSPGWEKGLPKFVKVARLGGYYSVKYFKTCDNFVVITPDLQKHLMNNGVAAERIIQINNFAETEDVKMPVSRADLDTPDDAKVFLALGRLHTKKAFDILIKAAAMTPNAYVWIAGEGPERENLEQLIQDKNVGDRVKLLGWRTDRAALFEASDYCIFPSRYEPFGTVFVQAWMNKSPLIVSDAQGPSQFVRDGEDCLLIPKDDVEATAEAMQCLIDDPALCTSLVEQGWQRYESEFIKEKTVQAYLDYFEGLIESA